MMNFHWIVEDSGALPPNEIMAKDAEMLSLLKNDSAPLLHFYEWASPSVTYGYFIDPTEYLDMEALKQLGIQSARRPTGGGIIFHLSDLAFSILIPTSHPSVSLNTLDNYAFINKKIAKAISQFTQQLIQPHLLPQETSSHPHYQNFCMAKPTQYDLIFEGKKIGGAAQRRTKNGLLHQASLFLFKPPFTLFRQIIHKNYSIAIDAMEKNSYSVFPYNASLQVLKEISGLIRNYIQQAIFEI